MGHIDFLIEFIPSPQQPKPKFDSSSCEITTSIESYLHISYEKFRAFSRKQRKHKHCNGDIHENSESKNNPNSQCPVNFPGQISNIPISMRHNNTNSFLFQEVSVPHDLFQSTDIYLESHSNIPICGQLQSQNMEDKAT